MFSQVSLCPWGERESLVLEPFLDPAPMPFLGVGYMGHRVSTGVRVSRSVVPGGMASEGPGMEVSLASGTHPTGMLSSGTHNNK